MIKVGLTGGMGSGKTTIARIFMQLGVPIYFSDTRAKYLMQNNKFLQESLISLFGSKVFTNGLLNRSYISSIVFSNPEELVKLNTLVHPFVEKDFQYWLASKSTNYVLKEAAILFEVGADKFLDQVILVESPEDLKISRVILRDGITREEVLMRMAKQWSDDKKRTNADYIIYNNEKCSLLNQILMLDSIFSASQ